MIAGRRMNDAEMGNPGEGRVPRRKTRTVHVGPVPIGSGNPVVIQEMLPTPVRSEGDVRNAVKTIRRLAKAGCQLVRVAVPDLESARLIGVIRERSGVPIVADIHFDHRLALEAIKSGADKIRINPGNIGSAKKVSEVAAAAKARGVPIRIGVNSGSLSRNILDEYGMTPQALVESCLREVALLEREGFQDIVLSLKSTDVRLTVEANRLIAARVDYPLHIGITEAGFGTDGVIRSALGTGILLAEGIGDTIRVSLSNGDGIREIPAMSRASPTYTQGWTSAENRMPPIRMAKPAVFQIPSSQTSKSGRRECTIRVCIQPFSQRRRWPRQTL